MTINGGWTNRYMNYNQTFHEYFRFHSSSDLQRFAVNLMTSLSNHMPSKVLGQMNYQFPDINGTTVEVYEWVSNFSQHVIMDAYDIHAGIKVNQYL